MSLRLTCSFSAREVTNKNDVQAPQWTRHHENLQLISDCVETVSIVCSSLLRRVGPATNSTWERGHASTMDLNLVDEVSFLMQSHAVVQSGPNDPSFTNALQVLETVPAAILASVGGLARLSREPQIVCAGFSRKSFPNFGESYGEPLLSHVRCSCAMLTCSNCVLCVQRRRFWI